MPFKHNFKLQHKTIEEFYTELKQNESKHWQEVGGSMLEYIDMVNSTFLITQFWGLTSHQDLVFQNKDGQSDRLIIVSPKGKSFETAYLMPERKRPWIGAYVLGWSNTVAEARKHLIIAINECEGWPNNEELAGLLKDL